ncbi:thioredoxin family protein [Paenibacillus sp. PK4536]|uniref:thioredoxin family protein n=1 Tax=Paenibacillus sp. PK4536 TaxID=3024576 RepID=UPI00235837DE|nr:thioredoxin family protein [Paenibacillus sp. PK4536]WIM40022.1 thioredoxin family protein [Paenibacillus sp. PK4536]
MKKLVIVLTGVFLITAILFFSIGKLMNSEVALYKDIKTTDVQQMESNKQDFILYLYQKTCIACKQVKPIINDYIKSENKDIYAIDINADNNKNFIIQDLEIQGTPTVIFYKKGKENSRMISTFTKQEFYEKANKIEK